MKLQTERITDLTLPELDCYARLREPQLSHLFEPEPGIFIAESPVVIGRALEAGYRPLSFLLEESQLPLLDELSGQMRQPGADPDELLPVYVSDMEVLAGITGYRLTRGMLCAMRRPAPADPRQIIKNARSLAILENVMNPTNVGAIIRSAAALGVEGILLTKGCSDPLYRRAIRVSTGNVFKIPWAWVGEDTPLSWPQGTLAMLKEAGFTTAAMTPGENSLPLDDPRLTAGSKVAVLLGTEGEGLQQQTIMACDYAVRIPMSAGVDSLNVAAASAVTFWQLCRKKRNM